MKQFLRFSNQFFKFLGFSDAMFWVSRISRKKFGFLRVIRSNFCVSRTNFRVFFLNFILQLLGSPKFCEEIYVFLEPIFESLWFYSAVFEFLGFYEAFS